jgi:hypothetical protein
MRVVLLEDIVLFADWAELGKQLRTHKAGQIVDMEEKDAYEFIRQGLAKEAKRK